MRALESATGPRDKAAKDPVGESPSAHGLQEAGCRIHPLASKCNTERTRGDLWVNMGSNVFS